MKIKINYIVDSPDWTDGQFEDESSREFVITEDMITHLIRQSGGLNGDEFLHEIDIDVTP